MRRRFVTRWSKQQFPVYYLEFGVIICGRSGTQTSFYFRAVGPNGRLPGIPLKRDMRAVINVLRNPRLALCARIFVGGVIPYAGFRKIGDLSGMARSVENDRLLPASG
ncbi:MAG TPA: hypothetical protein PLQ35_03540 [bacterium]|nr:hypothetical protein [bacterium]HQL61346.1 hypothetical protein [bacterium]